MWHKTQTKWLQQGTELRDTRDHQSPAVCRLLNESRFQEFNCDIGKEKETTLHCFSDMYDYETVVVLKGK